MDRASQVFAVAGTHIVHEHIDGETIVINLENGQYYSLDPLGSQIWLAAAAGVPAAEIVTEIVRRSAQEHAQVAAAAEGFLQQLLGAGLFRLVPDATGEPPAGTRFFDALGPGPVAPSLQAYTDMQELLALDPIHEVDASGWPSRDAL